MGGGKGAQEGEAENAETISQKPMLNFLVGMINSNNQRFMGIDKNVTAVFNDVDNGSLGDLTAAQANQTMLFSAQATPNDIQEKLGKPSFEGAWADATYIVIGGTVQPLETVFSGAYEQQGQQNGQSQSGVVSGSDSQGNNGQSQENPQVAQGQGPAKGDQGQAPPSELKANEAKAYKRFLSKSHSREFEFLYHTDQEVELLKSGEILKGPSIPELVS